MYSLMIIFAGAGLAPARSPPAHRSTGSIRDSGQQLRDAAATAQGIG